ncbi:hypothetical protein SLEP1_g55721 [Rubroshorea leprosula]|uniref:HAT C-terminal dimerisation domain-containing protein n=1 Tax=Rubroshorea leprosula TaxID=152421 RepID=A0AAV5MJG0_9ROSI|nr:hypothetical protein SLEP1_g55721 [Rubroshorea leprosula]
MSKTVKMCPDLQIGDGGGDDSAQIYRSVMVVVTIMLSPFPSSPISPSIFDFSKKRFKRAVDVIFGDGVRHLATTNSSDGDKNRAAEHSQHFLYARQDPHMKNELNDGPNAPGFPACIDWENMYGRKADGELDDNGPLYVAMVKREMEILFEEYKRLNSSTAKSSDPQSFDEQGSSSTSATNIQSVADSKNRVQTSEVKSDYKKFKAANGRRAEKTELEKYLAEDSEDENEDIDVLQWWKMNEHRFPVLATMARDVLAVPISTIASKSAFSSGGQVLDAFRSSLTPRMAQALICAQDWLRDKAVSDMEEEDLDTLDSLEKCNMLYVTCFF